MIPNTLLFSFEKEVYMGTSRNKFDVPFRAQNISKTAFFQFGYYGK